MLIIGCHLSAARGYSPMVRQAETMDANTFAFFTRNPRGSRAKAGDAVDTDSARKLLSYYDFGPFVAHGAYTMNLCGRDEEVRSFAAGMLEEDLRRLAELPGNFYNFHPGSHVGQGVEAGIDYISKALRKALEPDYPVTVLLETMAGKGSEIGRSFEELRDILDAVGSNRLGVCLDTCHVYDAGYNIAEDLEGVLAEFDRIIGLNRLKALHLNDSQNACGSHKDRHERIGRGSIGLETFRKIVNHPALAGKPMILETPNEFEGYRQEVALLRDLAKPKREW